jgi:phage shock protein A
VDEATNLQGQIDMQNASIDKLYEGMQVLETSIMDAKSKKEQMIARARTAESTQKVNDMLSGVSGNTSMDAFKRMEDKVEALEASAEVSAEMGALGGNMLPGGSDLEKEFKKLEAADSVDDELKKMKGLLGGAPEEKKKSSVDDELEKLKRDAGL